VFYELSQVKVCIRLLVDVPHNSHSELFYDYMYHLTTP